MLESRRVSRQTQQNARDFRGAPRTDVAGGFNIVVREIGCDVGLKSALRFIRTHILCAINVHEKEL